MVVKGQTKSYLRFISIRRRNELMHGLDEWEDIRLNDTVRVISGEHLGRVGVVKESHMDKGYETGPCRVRYVVVFRSGAMHCREFDPNMAFAAFEAIYPNPPAFVRITSEEAAEMVTTTADTIGK